MLPPSQSCLCKCEHTMQHPTAEAATWKTSVERAPRTQPDPFFLLQMLEPIVTGVYHALGPGNLNQQCLKCRAHAVHGWTLFYAAKQSSKFQLIAA